MIMFAVFLWIRKRDRERSINFAKVKKNLRTSSAPNPDCSGLEALLSSLYCFRKKRRESKIPAPTGITQLIP